MWTEYDFQIGEQDQTFNMRMDDDTALAFTLGEAIHVVANTDYNALYNKPQIEGVMLEGDKSYEELNLQRISNADIEALFQNL